MKDTSWMMNYLMDETPMNEENPHEGMQNPWYKIQTAWYKLKL